MSHTNSERTRPVRSRDPTDKDRLYELGECQRRRSQTFSDSCIDYPYFITSFIKEVETRIKDPRCRLIRLLKYLNDEAKELVQPCVYLPASKGYIKARKRLEKNGDQYRILSEYRKKLRTWPKLRPDDGKPFRKFSVF